MGKPRVCPDPFLEKMDEKAMNPNKALWEKGDFTAHRRLHARERARRSSSTLGINDGLQNPRPRLRRWHDGASPAAELRR